MSYYKGEKVDIISYNTGKSSGMAMNKAGKIFPVSMSEVSEKAPKKEVEEKPLIDETPPLENI
jgi:hypothetical protein